MTDLIVDASSLFARSFFAATNSRFSSDIRTEEPTLTVAMRTVIHLLDPGRDNLGTVVDRMLAAWDGRQNPKKEREPKPPEYHTLKREFQQLLADLFQPTQITAGPDEEADDIVASAVAESDAGHVYVVSGDKDLTQLHQPGVSFYDLNQKRLITAREICERWGVKAPNHVALALAVIGDPVDAIKGIPGWGPAKTKKLFAAVREGAPLDEALKAITAQIPEDLADSFWSSLERTLLKPDLNLNMPAAEIVYADAEYVSRLNLGLSLDYERMLSSLEDRQPVRQPAPARGSRSAAPHRTSGSRSGSR